MTDNPGLTRTRKSTHDNDETTQHPHPCLQGRPTSGLWACSCTDINLNALAPFLRLVTTIHGQHPTRKLAIFQRLECRDIKGITSGIWVYGVTLVLVPCVACVHCGATSLVNACECGYLNFTCGSSVMACIKDEKFGSKYPPLLPCKNIEKKNGSDVRYGRITGTKLSMWR